jgi:pimeloyl-ACP methyl ester carboxylesterase
VAKPILVIIPGIGDHTPIYSLFAWIWRRFGYEVHILPFGWSHYYADISVKTKDFLHRLDAATDKQEAFVIGISAGGTAAIHAYANRGYIRRVVAVCTPFTEFENIQNRLLADGIIVARQDLKGFDVAEKANILSVFGLYDQTVADRMSRPEGVRYKRLWLVRHAAIIFAAMTFRSGSLKRFLRKGR